MSIKRIWLVYARGKGSTLAQAQRIAEEGGAEVERQCGYLIVTCYDPDRFYWADNLADSLREDGFAVTEPAERGNHAECFRHRALSLSKGDR